MAQLHSEFRDEVAAALAEVESMVTPEPRLRITEAVMPVRITEAVMPVRRESVRIVSTTPWTPAAAMLPVPLPPIPLVLPEAPQPLRRGHAHPEDFDDRPPRSWRRAVASASIGLFAAAGAATAVLVGLHPFSSAASPAGPPPPVITVTGMRPVSVATVSQALIAPTSPQFPAGTAVVYLDVRYQGDASAGPLNIWVTETPATSGGPDTAIANRSFLLGLGGETVIPLVAPSGVFAPGNYRVIARIAGTDLASSSFVVSSTR